MLLDRFMSDGSTGGEEKRAIGERVELDEQ